MDNDTMSHTTSKIRDFINHKWALVLYMFFLLTVVPGYLIIGAFFLPMQYDKTFMGELKYKYERLRESEGKRIVLLGGSSLAFGIDSALIEEYLPDYEVVNFGMYAALGTTAMFDLTIDEIRSGDIVIISPEQNDQALSDYFNAEIMWQGLDGSVSLLSRFNRDKLQKLMGQFPYFAVNKWNYWKNHNMPVPTGVYSRAAFNQYGDIEWADCKQNIMPMGYDTTTLVEFSDRLPEKEFLQECNQYIDTLTERGCKVWYRFAPMNDLAVDDSIDIDAYYDQLQQSLHCEMMGNPNDMIMDAKWFYDTNFHLNQSGRVYNTRQIIRDIKAMLGDSSPTLIVVPEAPEMKQKCETALEEGDIDCFIYEMRNQSAFITGLTEEGKKRSILTIPAKWDGEIVSGIASEAFKDEKQLKRLFLQKNICIIEDNAFLGCSNLEQIILEEIEPEGCQVGFELMNGTDAVLLTEPELVSSYKVNYAWSIYSNRISSQ